MATFTRKRSILITISLLVLGGVLYGFWPDPVPVQVATAQRDSLRVTVEEEGETRVRERYEVASPVAAYARRIEVEVGDHVEQGDLLVELEAPRSSILDSRSQTEARARVEAARAQVQQAEHRVEAAEATAEQARTERKRTERLAEQGSATAQAVDRAVSEDLQARANLEAARAAAARARTDLMNARAVLQTDPAIDQQHSVQSVLRSPASGRILTVHRKSAGTVSPGEPLVTIGNTDMLEIRVDVLSQDALRVEPGTPVLIDQWGGDHLLRAVVDRVDPEGETTVSALGVEEQRVTVVAHIVSPREQWKRVGSGYRVLARFIVWEDDDVLQIPTSAIFRTSDNEWAVFVIDGGRAVRQAVTIGQQSGLTAQILSGLEEGDEVIIHPGNDVEDGVRVAGGTP